MNIFSILWHRFWSWSSPSVSEGDDVQILAAWTLQLVLSGLILWAAMFMAVGIPLFVVKKLPAVVFGVLLLLLCFATILLLRNGRINQAGKLFLSGMWIMATVLNLLAGGISSNSLLIYIPLIVTAAWLLGHRAALVCGCIFLGQTLIMAVMAKIGIHFPKYFPAPPIASWLVLTLFLAIAILPLNHVLQMLQETLTLARQRVVDLEKSERALREGEERVRTIIEMAPDGIFFADALGRFIEVNEAACKQLGYTREQLLQRSIVDIVSKERAESTTEQILAAATSVDHYQCNCIRSDGTEFPVELGVAKMVFRGRPVAVLIARDISERKQAEEHVQALADATFEGIAFSEAGRLVEVNDQFARMLGYERSQMAGMEIASFIPMEDHERVMSNIREGRESLIEHPMIRKDGSFIAVEVHGKTGVRQDRLMRITAIRDITDRKRMEQSLRESEERFRTLFENSPIGIYRTTPDGHILAANPALIKMLGCSSFEELAARNLENEGFEPTYPRASFKTRMEIEGGVTGLESVWTTADNKDVFIRENAAAIRGVEGTVLYYEGTVEDITEQRNLEQQLRQAIKMESVGRLAGGVAHDFNNMLTVILGHTEMALAQTDPTQQLHQDLQKIQKAAKRSADLTGQLLAFARKQMAAPKVLDVNKTVEGMLDMLRRLIGEDIRLTWLPGVFVSRVKIDPSQLDQIIVNLFANARDAITGAGRVTIETGNVTLDESFYTKHDYVVPGEYVLIAVSDSGCGMDKEVLNNIFEPFYTTKGMGQGTGLGLATVYGIVKQNNGYINSYSELGKGTTFKIYLPQCRDVGSVIGYEYPPSLAQLRDSGLIVLEKTNSETLNLKKLDEGRIDAALITHNEIKTYQNICAKAGVKHEIRPAFRSGELKSYIGFSVRHPRGQWARERFDAGFAVIRKNGVLTALIAKWKGIAQAESEGALLGR